MQIDLHQMLRERGMKLTEVASAIGVDKATVTRWAQKRVPEDRVLDVERVTGIPRHVLRPDLAAVFGPSDRSAA